jgi:protein-tyrosine phosphatase
MHMNSLKYFIKQSYFSGCYILHKSYQRASLKGLDTILFVCQGNICRSAFSEYYMRMIFQGMGINIMVTSSGISAKQSENSPYNAIVAAETFNIDLRGHRPKRITQDMVDHSSIIIGMHYQNYKDFKSRFPADGGKFFLLKHLVWPRYFLLNINDPFNGPIDQYIKCFSEIKESIDMLADKIKSKTHK